MTLYTKLCFKILTLFANWKEFQVYLGIPMVKNEIKRFAGKYEPGYTSIKNLSAAGQSTFSSETEEDQCRELCARLKLTVVD